MTVVRAIASPVKSADRGVGPVLGRCGVGMSGWCRFSALSPAAGPGQADVIRTFLSLGLFISCLSTNISVRLFYLKFIGKMPVK